MPMQADLIIGMGVWSGHLRNLRNFSASNFVTYTVCTVDSQVDLKISDCYNPTELYQLSDQQSEIADCWVMLIMLTCTVSVH